MPENEKFEVVTINPYAILGPFLGSPEFSSAEIMIKLMTNDLPGMPRVMLGAVHVKDVA